MLYTVVLAPAVHQRELICGCASPRPRCASPPPEPPRPRPPHPSGSSQPCAELPVLFGGFPPAVCVCVCVHTQGCVSPCLRHTWCWCVSHTGCVRVSLSASHMGVCVCPCLRHTWCRCVSVLLFQHVPPSPSPAVTRDESSVSA